MGVIELIVLMEDELWKGTSAGIAVCDVELGLPALNTASSSGR